MIKIKKFSPKYSLKAFLYLIPLSFSVCIIGNIVAVFIPGAADNEVSNEIYKMLSDGKLLEAVIIVGVLAPIIEELFFRLFLYYLIKRFFGYKVAIVATAVAFAIAHMNLAQGIYALLAGLIFGYVRYKYNSIFCTIFMHLFMNVMVVLIANYFIIENDIRQMIFIFFIAITMFLLSMYRINIIFNERRI